jgi:glycosyltransferase involved in cell wall biosynthesis
MPTLVLHVTPGGLEHGGGIGRVISYMIDAWRAEQRQAEMRVIDTRGPGHILLSPWYFARSLITIALAARSRPILHVHFAGRGSTIRKIILVHFSRTFSLPVVLHLHDYDYRNSLQRFPGFVQQAVRSMFAIAKRTVVLGQGDFDLVVDTIGVDPAAVTIVPNAVPAPPRQSTRITSTGGTHILFLGNPSRRKGLHDLIAALASKPLRTLDWHLTVAGGGNEIDSFRQLAKDSDLSHRVKFTGWLDRTETNMLLASADIVTLPSYAEGMAMSVLEAMSHGSCIVCTPVGSLKYVVQHEVTGLLVEPGNVEQLSAAISRAICDSKLRATLGARAAEMFAARFDAARFPAQLQEIYEAAYSDCR